MTREKVAEVENCSGTSFYDFLRDLHTHSLLAAANRDEGGNSVVSKGLVHGHAYSLLKIEEITVNGTAQKMVRLRNPWGTREWNGAWSDGSAEWENVDEDEKARIGYEDKYDGGFWMSFEDWIDEFEAIQICILPKVNFFDETIDV